MRLALWALFAAALAIRPSTGSVQGIAIRPSSTAIAAEADGLLDEATSRFPFLRTPEPDPTGGLLS